MLLQMKQEIEDREESPITVELQIRTVEIDEAATLAHDTEYKQKPGDSISPVWEGWERYEE